VSPSRWLLVALSFVATLGASAFVVWSTWPAEGGSVGLPLLAHAFGGGAFLLELLSRAWKIQLSARALRVPLSFGAALRTCLGGDFGAAVTPARSGAEPARYLVLAEARVPAAGRLLILFAELVLEMLSLVAVAVGLAILFRGGGRALLGLEGFVGAYAAFVLGVGALGLLLARRNASGPPPRWAAWIGAGRWRGVQRSLRSLRTSVDAVRGARGGIMTLAFLASVVHVVARVLILPGLLLGAGALEAPTRATLAPLVLWPLALQYGGVVAPVPGGGGVIETAFAAALGGVIPARVFGASLIWWRVYTFYAYVVLGAVAAGRTALRALRQRGRRHAAVAAAASAPPATAAAA
jgi:uncharacterized membrane protein YbhN (UPF0104 family)